MCTQKTQGTVQGNWKQKKRELNDNFGFQQKEVDSSGQNHCPLPSAIINYKLPKFTALLRTN